MNKLNIHAKIDHFIDIAFLQNKVPSLDDNDIKNITEYIKHASYNAYIYPTRLAHWCGISSEEASKVLLILAVNGLFDHYAIPEYNNTQLESFAQRGFSFNRSPEYIKYLYDNGHSKQNERLITAYKFKSELNFN